MTKPSGVPSRWVGTGSPSFELELAAVALVADDRVLAAELVAPLQPGPLEDPVVGAVGGEGSLAVHELAVAEVIAAVEEADAGELVLGPVDQVVAPERGERAVVARGEDRVLVVPLLPAGQGAAVFLAADLPAAGIPAEERDVAAPADERLQVVAHRGRPVLVVPDAEDELVRLEELGMELEVAVGAVVERVPVALGPGDERQLPLAELPFQRPVEGDAVSLEIGPAVVGVEAAAAPVVVGVVGVGARAGAGSASPCRAGRAGR